ncbi:succinylglutamate desuccinylase/aspartoacylase family protein [Echinicola soli]|nr:succinylglutamate desuccinylase/aspartoacylase family protein [Echinicola soli]
MPGILHAQQIKDIPLGSRRDTVVYFGKEDSLAVTVIKGKHDGPVFSMVAGVHGFEYPPIMAVQELMQKIQPEKLHGTLVILPLANEAAFYGRSVFTNPVDGKNLNRVFPGKAEGTVTEQIAYWISQEVIPVSDVFLDIHGGDASEDLLPFVCYYNRTDKPEQVALAHQLTEAANFEYNVIYPYTLAPDAPSEYAFKEAVQQGKTALSIEAGKLGSVQPVMVEMISTGVMNMLTDMGMYPSEINSSVNQKWFEAQVYLKSPSTGLFYSKIKSGDKVTKGQVLGNITNIFGEKLEDISAPSSGIVLYKVGTPPVNKGETLFCIGK